LKILKLSEILKVKKFKMKLKKSLGFLNYNYKRLKINYKGFDEY